MHATSHLSTALTAIAFGLFGAPAFAQDTLAGSWTVGVAQVPEYEGSDDYQTLPTLGFRLERGGRSIEFQGTSLRVDLLPSQTLEAGPVLNYRFGRKDVANPAVALLPSVDPTVELGGYAALAVPSGAGAFRLSAEVLADAGGVHDGIMGTLSAGYGSSVSDRLSLGAAVSLTAVSDGYARTYFSVDPDGAVASGLTAYEARGGIKDAGLDLMISYAVSESSTVSGFASYRRLLGDFADSPVVNSGSDDQMTFGLLFTRSF